MCAQLAFQIKSRPLINVRTASDVNHGARARAWNLLTVMAIEMLYIEGIWKYAGFRAYNRWFLKMETFCLTPKPVLMCLVGVGKCMGAVYSRIGSAWRVLGPSGNPKKARFSSSSKDKNYRPIVARPVGWLPLWLPIMHQTLTSIDYIDWYQHLKMLALQDCSSTGKGYGRKSEAEKN